MKSDTLNQDRERIINKFPHTSKVEIVLTDEKKRYYTVKVVQENHLTFSYTADFTSRSGWLILTKKANDTK